MLTLVNDLKEMLVDMLEYAYIEGDATKEFSTVLAEELQDLSELRDDAPILEAFKLITENELHNIRLDVCYLILKWYNEAEIDSKHYHEAIINLAPTQTVYEEFFNKII